MILNTFPPNQKIEWVACDTETHTFFQGLQLSTPELSIIERQAFSEQVNPQAYLRERLSVSVWAWQVSDGEHFAILESFEEFFEFLKEHEVSSGWWYNGKFDFAQIDYHILKNGWKEKDFSDKTPVDNVFSSLHSDMGQRYSYSLYYTKAKPNRHKKQMQIDFFDFCNILGGGLKNILNSLSVTDFSGAPIRKTEMDYQSETISNSDLEYMENDVKGLYHAIRIFNETVEQETDGICTLTGKEGKRCITAGGIAKNTLLYYLYGAKPYINVKAFQKNHPIDVEHDHYFRDYGLYRGGITMINPEYIGKEIKQKLWRYDVNSMYPAQMAKMPDLIGRGQPISYGEWREMKPDEKKKFTAIFALYDIEGKMKENMIPFWYDRLTKKYTKIIREGTESETFTFLIFEEEFEELKNYYDMVYKIDFVILFQNAETPGFSDFVTHFFALKDKAKREKNGVLKAFSKLILNSSYGKLSENPEKVKTHYEYISDIDSVRLSAERESEISERCILSVVQGALITSMARTFLMKAVRTICENPREQFTYCDTDSIHVLIKCDNPEIIDDYEIGKLKAERGRELNPETGKTVESGVDFFSISKYIAPKTYYEKCGGENGLFEFHSKGINIVSIEKACSGKSDEEVNRIFAKGQKFFTLCAMNVTGGKAIVEIEKYLAREDKKTRTIDFGEMTIEDEMTNESRQIANEIKKEE